MSAAQDIARLAPFLSKEEIERAAQGAREDKAAAQKLRDWLKAQDDR